MTVAESGQIFRLGLHEKAFADPTRKAYFDVACAWNFSGCENRFSCVWRWEGCFAGISGFFSGKWLVCRWSLVGRGALYSGRRQPKRWAPQKNHHTRRCKRQLNTAVIPELTPLNLATPHPPKPIMPLATATLASPSSAPTGSSQRDTQNATTTTNNSPTPSRHAQNSSKAHAWSTHSRQFFRPLTCIRSCVANGFGRVQL